jgi:23S rRNA (adenine2503-C2)-methyltransferase
MSISKTRINLLDLDEAGLREFFESIGEKPFRAQQLLKWIYHQQVSDFTQMTNLGVELRHRLHTIAEIRAPEILAEQKSVDGTVKWLMGFGGGNAVETVFIPEPRRGTLCISSQVGCALNCTFCATGAQGFSRNLAASEIIGQVWQAARALNHQRNGQRIITNVVLMGMGEPLLNFEAVVTALALLRNDLGFGLAAKRVTLSTAGLVPGIDKLKETIDVALAVSLHAPDDELRESLVPLNRKYPIERLMKSCADYISGKHKRTVTFEYTLIDGINDHPDHARKLVKLLRRLPSKLNLIPFNPFPGTYYRCSPDSRIREFQDIVMHGGLIATVRKTRGDDIDAACGQLVGRVMDRTRRSERIREQMARPQSTGA